MKYCKPELSFFIFTSYERSECFIFGVKRKMLHNEVASSEKAGPDWVKHAFRRMKHFAALPQNMKHRRCGMKQSLFRLHIFCLEIKAKKWRLEFLSSSATLNGFFSLKTQNIAVKSFSKNHYTFIQKNSEYTA